MPVVINEVSVEPAPATPTAPAPAAAVGPTDAAVAQVAERMWRRVIDLQERVRAD